MFHKKPMNSLSNLDIQFAGKSQFNISKNFIIQWSHIVTEGTFKESSCTYNRQGS